MFRFFRRTRWPCRKAFRPSPGFVGNRGQTGFPAGKNRKRAPVPPNQEPTAQPRRRGRRRACPLWRPIWPDRLGAPAAARSFRVRQLAAAFYPASLLAAGRLKSRLPEGNGQSLEIPRASSRGGKRQQATALQSSASANGLEGGPGVGTIAGGIMVKMSVAYGNQIAELGGVELSLGEIAQSCNTICGRRRDRRVNLAAGVASAAQRWRFGRNRRTPLAARDVPIVPLRKRLCL